MALAAGMIISLLQIDFMIGGFPEFLPDGNEIHGAGGKMKVFLIIVIVLLVLIIGAGAYFIVKEVMKPTTSTTSTKTSATVSPSASASASGSDLQSAYDAAADIEASTTKAKAVDAEVKPALKTVFTNNVKLKEDMSGSLLTYITNREVVAADVTAFKTAMETAGYRTLDSSETGLTLSKGANTLVFTFPVGNKTKATIDMTL